MLALFYAESSRDNHQPLSIKGFLHYHAPPPPVSYLRISTKDTPRHLAHAIIDLNRPLDLEPKLSNEKKRVLANINPPPLILLQQHKQPALLRSITTRDALIIALRRPYCQR